MAETTRIDSWVWAVRLAKTRSQATAMCRAGHVRINDQTVKAAASVKIDDVVRVRIHGFDTTYRVKGIASRRGSAPEAAKLYEDLSPPPIPKEERAFMPVRDRGAGRPTKKERRELDKLLGRNNR